MKRVGLAERTGRGIDRIFEGSLIYGRLLPDYSALLDEYSIMKNTYNVLYNSIQLREKGVLIVAKAVNVNFRLDEDVKKNMEQVCADLGLSMSAAFTIFAKKVSREKRIPFDVSIDPFYAERNIRYLEQKMEDYKAGYINVAEHELIEE